MLLQELSKNKAGKKIEHQELVKALLQLFTEVHHWEDDHMLFARAKQLKVFMREHLAKNPI
jgi:hypothetical protein